MLMHVINVGHDVLKANDKLAAKNQKLLDKYGVLAINFMGAIGSGKTTLIEKTVENLDDKYRLAVIAGDVIADMDAGRIAKLGVTTIPVNTGRECHLDAKLVEKALK
jgi:hydrogenase nickel incorporation protein HypB